MPTSNPHASLAPDQRRQEIASILALGVLRYRQQAALRLLPHPCESSPPPQNGLELSGKNRLHVSEIAAG